MFCQSVPQECRARVSVRQECLVKVSRKSAPQRVCHKSVTKECPTRLSEKSVKQECFARVAFNAIEHLLFAFHCSVGTLLLRSGSWLLSGFLNTSANPERTGEKKAKPTPTKEKPRSLHVTNHKLMYNDINGTHRSYMILADLAMRRHHDRQSSCFPNHASMLSLKN